LLCIKKIDFFLIKNKRYIYINTTEISIESTNHYIMEQVSQMELLADAGALGLDQDISKVDEAGQVESELHHPVQEVTTGDFGGHMVVEHHDPGPPVSIETKHFDQQGFVTYDGIAYLVEIGRIPEDLAGTLYEQSINFSLYYRETYLPELGPSVWIGNSSNVQYSPRKGTWMKRHSYEKINNNGQQEYAYCWIDASEDDLPIDHADISYHKNKIAQTMSTMITNYNINHDSYYTDLDGWKRRTKLAVE